MCPRPLQRRDTDTHSRNTRRWATTQRGRPCRRQRRLSRHPPTREAVGPLALINHTVRRGWERKIRPASTGRRRARRADAGRKSPLLGGEKRRASLPPFFFFPSLGSNLATAQCTDKVRGTRDRGIRRRLSRRLSPTRIGRGRGGTDRVTRPLSYGASLLLHRHRSPAAPPACRFRSEGGRGGR